MYMILEILMCVGAISLLMVAGVVWAGVMYNLLEWLLTKLKLL
jgi:hypothetical protein